MKKISFLLLVSFLITFSTTGKTQNDCYIQLGDLSGFNTSPYQPELEAAACELIQAFPSEFQEQFKVYSFGFYVHNEYMQGGFEDAFQKVADEIQTPYYLVIGRQTDHTGIYSRFWVELELPDRGNFSCFNASTRNFLKFSISKDITSKYNDVGKVPDLYSLGEIAGMSNLMDFVEKAKACCDPERGRSTCSFNCPENMEIVKDMLVGNGFTEIPLSDITVSAIMDTNGIVKQYANISAKIGAKMIDVNEDITDFLIPISAKMEGVKGSISHYDYFSPNCEEVMNIIFLGNYENNSASAILKEDEKDRNDRNRRNFRDNPDDNFLYRVDVISLVDAQENAFLYVRNLSIFDFQSNSSFVGTIFLVKLDNVSVNMSDVVTHVRNFYDLIDIFVQLKSEFIHEADINPNDAICIIGDKPSEIVGFARGTYCNLSDEWGSALVEFLKKPIPEKGQSDESRQLSIIATRRVDARYISALACDNLTKTVAFLAFHATGHNAGFRHTNCNLGNWQGYMSAAPDIVHKLGGGDCGYNCYGVSLTEEDYTNGDCFRTIEDLIKSTPRHIIEKVKRRYQGF